MSEHGGHKIITIQKAVKTYGVSVDTLRRWADQGSLPCWRSPNNVRMFRQTDLEKFFNVHSDQIEQSKQIVYCRVSSSKQRDDLQRQIDFMQKRYPDHIVISDIGSGINFRRKGLQTILDTCLRRELKEVVVAHKDRLCRFGFELIEHVITASGGRIIVLDDENHKSEEQELSDDLLSIVHVFNCRQMGRRRYNKSTDSKSENLSHPQTTVSV